MDNQIGENLRFHVEMRFKQLTLFIAFLSLSVAGISGFGTNNFLPGLSTGKVISFAGIIFTSVLLIMEIRSSLYWRKHHEINPSLWPTPDKNFLSFINSTNAVLFLYLAVLSFWCFSAHKWFESCFISVLVFITGGSMFLYSIINYWPIWKND